MKGSRESRLGRLERAAAEVARQGVPVAVLADEECNVSKVFTKDRIFVVAPPGLMTHDLALPVKVYLFNPDCDAEPDFVSEQEN
ncbi:MAG: hypothetical protein U0744_03220 [Gemmataceae bacterium]